MILHSVFKKGGIEPFSQNPVYLIKIRSQCIECTSHKKPTFDNLWKLHLHYKTQHPNMDLDSTPIKEIATLLSAGALV